MIATPNDVTLDLRSIFSWKPYHRATQKMKGERHHKNQAGMIKVNCEEATSEATFPDWSLVTRMFRGGRPIWSCDRELEGGDGTAEATLFWY